MTPNARKSQVTKVSEEDYFEVKVDAKPEDGRANIRLLEILSDYFGVSKSSISILKGAKSRDKLIEIVGEQG